MKHQSGIGNVILLLSFFFLFAIFVTLCFPEPTVVVITWIFFLGLLCQFKKAYNEDKSTQNAINEIQTCKNPELQKKLKDIYVKYKVIPPDIINNQSEQNSFYSGRSITLDTAWMNQNHNK